MAAAQRLYAKVTKISPRVSGKRFVKNAFVSISGVEITISLTELPCQLSVLDGGSSLSTGGAILEILKVRFTLILLISLICEAKRIKQIRWLKCLTIPSCHNERRGGAFSSVSVKFIFNNQLDLQSLSDN